MSAPQVTAPGGAAASATSVPGLVSAPGEIVRLPQELAARLLQGLRTVILSGTVTGQAADGALQVRSQFGEIAVRTNASVPADRQISLQIPPLSGKAATLTPAQLTRQPIPASLLLPKPAATAPAGATAATSTSAATASALPTPTAAAPGGVPAAPAAAAAPTPAAGPLPIATKPATPPPPGPVPGGAAQPLPAASQPVPRAGSPPAAAGASPSPDTAARPVPAPQSAPAATAPSTSAATTAPATQGGAQPNPAASPPLGRLAMATQMLTQSGGQPATGAASTPPPGPSPQASASAAPQAATGGPPPSAAATAPAGAAARIPTEAVIGGARVAATAAREPTLPPTGGREPARDAIPLESIRRVPVLREAVAVLGAADPTLATQFVRSVMPQANTQLAATLLFFLSAARGGDVRGWMGGRVAAALEDDGRADLMPRLAAELSAPTRPAPDGPAGEWRSQPIPLYQDGEIGGMTVHLRRSGDEGGLDGEGDGAGQRFLLDVDLSRMGPLQFDGLVRDRRFDLVIRSQAALPESMRQDIRTLFRDASDAVGLRGGLTFQAGGHDWVTVANARGAQ